MLIKRKMPMVVGYLDQIWMLKVYSHRHYTIMVHSGVIENVK